MRFNLAFFPGGFHSDWWFSDQRLKMLNVVVALLKLITGSKGWPKETILSFCFHHLFSLYTDYGHPDGCTIFLSYNVTMEFPLFLGQQHPVVVASSFEQSMLFSTAKLESKCSVSLLTDKQNGISKRLFDAFGKHVRIVLPESANSCPKIPVRGLKRPLVWFCHKREQVPIII